MTANIPATDRAVGAATGGTEGVGRVTTRAVVAGSVAVITVDFFLSRL